MNSLTATPMKLLARLVKFIVIVAICCLPSREASTGGGGGSGGSSSSSSSSRASDVNEAADDAATIKELATKIRDAEGRRMLSDDEAHILSVSKEVRDIIFKAYLYVTGTYNPTFTFVLGKNNAQLKNDTHSFDRMMEIVTGLTKINLITMKNHTESKAAAKRRKTTGGDDNSKIHIDANTSQFATLRRNLLDLESICHERGGNAQTVKGAVLSALDLLEEVAPALLEDIEDDRDDDDDGDDDDEEDDDDGT